jgi:methylmalonyl-CoA mutase C-terminal domain/subunit
MDAGFEVIYTGLRKSVEDIAARARDEGVDVIGLSILSGSHLPICARFAELREEYGLRDRIWLVGGNIPAKDRDALTRLGVDAVFPFGSSLRSIVDYMNEHVTGIEQ